jgi:hypothetical protein
MSCSRCGGHMMEDHFLDSWRCVNCGRVHDSAIEQSRLAQHEKVLALPRGVPDDQDDEVHLGAESFIRRAA